MATNGLPFLLIVLRHMAISGFAGVSKVVSKYWQQIREDMFIHVTTQGLQLIPQSAA